MTRHRLAIGLDVLERALVLVLYGALVVRIVYGIRAHGAGLGNLLLLPSEGLVLLFVLLRRTTDDVSTRPFDWALALAATCLPMLVAPSPGLPHAPEAIAGVVVVTGTLVELHAKLVLRRSFGCVPANRGVVEAGPYRFVRHPMYAGYMLSHLGFLAMNPSLRNFALYAACTSLQIPRLLAEERLLARDAAYRRYRDAVRYRLVPGVF